MENLPLVVENIILDRKSEIEHVERTEKIHEEFSEIYESCRHCNSCREKDNICRGCIVNTGVYNHWIRWKTDLEQHLNANDVHFNQEYIRRIRQEIYDKIQTFDDYINYKIRRNLTNITCDEFDRLVETDRLRDRFLHGGYHIVFVGFIGGATMVSEPIYFDKITHTIFVLYYVANKYTFFPKPLINRIPSKKRIYKFCII